MVSSEMLDVQLKKTPVDKVAASDSDNDIVKRV